MPVFNSSSNGVELERINTDTVRTVRVLEPVLANNTRPEPTLVNLPSTLFAPGGFAIPTALSGTNQNVQAITGQQPITTAPVVPFTGGNVPTGASIPQLGATSFVPAPGTGVAVPSRTFDRNGNFDPRRGDNNIANSAPGGGSTVGTFTGTQQEATDAFAAGFQDNNGSNLQAFIGPRGILDGESGRNPNINNNGLNANGSTDHGIAQINDSIWVAEFERVTGQPFSTGVYDPYWSGYFSAHIERVQGLSAWVAYQNGFRGQG